ncbi:MAG: single-stranded DNA-binding protein [Ruminococcaceae bacterium]|nr:single-stranded DNA-binding protein [Oscillospiraceae bacterium]
MASLNKVILIGNLVADPELKKTPNGISVTSFRIAVGRRFTRDGEAPQADFIDIVAWRQSAEFVCQYFSKGKPILVCGSIQSRNWTDQNGQKRYTVEVVADEVSFVERKTDSQPRSAGTYYGEPPAAKTSEGAGIPDAAFVEVSSDDDLPF